MSVGLGIIPEEELVIGILNRLDMSRYASLVKDFLDHERRGIAALPILSAVLWKEIKDAQVIRFRGGGTSSLESVYLTSVDDMSHASHGRGRGGRDGRGNRGGRGGGRSGRGRGRGRTTSDSTISPPHASPSESITPYDIICWTCNKKGHRSSQCPDRSDKDKSVHFTEEDSHVFLTHISDFEPQSDDYYPQEPEPDQHLTAVHLSATGNTSSTTLNLDTQSSVNLV